VPLFAVTPLNRSESGLARPLFVVTPLNRSENVSQPAGTLPLQASKINIFFLVHYTLLHYTLLYFIGK